MIERKKARTSKSSQPKLDDSKKHWINLALLYRSIDEPEMFQHLYQCFVATQKLPKGEQADMKGIACNSQFS